MQKTKIVFGKHKNCVFCSLLTNCDNKNLLIPWAIMQYTHQTHTPIEYYKGLELHSSLLVIDNFKTAPTSGS